MNALDIPVQLPIFETLTPSGAQELSSLMESIHLSAGETLYQQGAPSDALYIIVSGSLQAILRHANNQENRVMQLQPGDCAGELAQFSGRPRSTTLIATGECHLLRLPATAIDHLAVGFPDIMNFISDQLLHQYQRTQTCSILTSLFGHLSDDTLIDLQDKVHWVHLDSGQELFHQKDPGNALYVVVQGRLRFSVEEANGTKHTLGEVGAGETIGEFALLAESETPESLRSATVYATRLTDVLAISRPAFESLISEYPHAVLNITRRILNRQRLIDQSVLLSSSALVICVIPTRSGLSSVSPHSQFARQLSDTLNETFGCSLLMDPNGFEEWYGKPGVSHTPLDHPTSLMINAWLDEQECKQQFVVYDTSPDVLEMGRLSPWAQRCIEDADILLLVGEAGENSTPGAVELLLKSAKTRARLELVLLHPSNCSVPSNTSAWLAPIRGIQAHHHVRLGSPADFHRLARRISGRVVGLALGGGGARGWAHIGAIRALEEANIEVDWVGGASIGSIIAAGLALGLDSSALGKLAVDFADPKKLLDYTLPYTSITSTKRITALLREICGDADIEDGWRPFFCVSANLTKGEEQIHLTGKMWKAIRASMAFPAVFAPVLENDCILIDGGAANNVPVDRMRELCPTGKVIGINLETGSPVNKEYRFGYGLSGWQALFSRFTKVKAPNMLDIVSGLVYSNNRYRLNETRGCADLIIDVPVEAYGLLEFDKYQPIMELGYKVAKEQLLGFKV